MLTGQGSFLHLSMFPLNKENSQLASNCRLLKSVNRRGRLQSLNHKRHGIFNEWCRIPLVKTLWTSCIILENLMLQRNIGITKIENAHPSATPWVARNSTSNFVVGFSHKPIRASISSPRQRLTQGPNVQTQGQHLAPEVEAQTQAQTGCRPNPGG